MRGPYSEDEQRVVDYLLEIIPEIGAGDDPIGFLIASHAAIRLDNMVLVRSAALDELAEIDADYI